MGISAKWRGRVPVALLTAGSLTVVGLAVGGAAGVPELEFLQPGRWVLNSAAGKVLHVDGSTKRVNAQVDMPGADRGSLVVQSDTSGYVVGRGKYTEFGKSTLRVEGTTAVPAEQEMPVALQVTGGPYLVYRKAGRVVRLGDDPPTPPIVTDEPLGNPVATPDGTVWLHYTVSGRLCSLPAGATTPSCPAEVPDGHTGGLTVVGDRPLFVNTTTDTIHVVQDNGLGRHKAIGTDLPATTMIGPGDVDGRVPMLDPGGALHLVDTADVVGDRPAARNVVVPLGPGDYTGPESTGSTVAVLDQRGTLHTYDSANGKRRTSPVPAEEGTPRLTKGEDSRLYVEGGEGKHVLVVDPGGAVTGVPTDGTQVPTSRSLAVPPSESATTTTVPPAADDQPRGQQTQQPRQQPQAQQTQPRQAPPPPAVPASPPGAPGLNAVPGNGSVALTWSPAAENGAPVTAYRITWNGGSATVGGGERAYTAPNLANGTTYTFTVVAQNSAGTGPGSTAQATPRQPMTITISRGRTESYNENCQAPDCSLIVIEMRGFAPNTDYTIVPYASRWGNFNSGHTSRSNAQGAITTERFHFGGEGQTVWVVAGGVESNRLYWEDR